MTLAVVLGRVRRAAHVTVVGMALAAVTPSVVRGADITVSWDHPSPSSAVAGYNLYYGTQSQNYTAMLDAGTNTIATVSNLSVGTAYYFAATSYSSGGLESGFSTEASYVVPVPNARPTLDPIGTVTINQDSGPQTVNLTGITTGSPSENQTLLVTAFSSNPALVPNPTVNYTSPSTTGSLVFAPAAASYGSSSITVMVDDGGSVSNTVIQTFLVNVLPVNAPPTLDGVTNLTINQNAGPQIVTVTGITSGSPSENQTLVLSASSSNPSLLPNPTVSYSSPGTVGTLSFTPVNNAYGSAKITVTVDDGGPTNNTTSTSFNVTVIQVTQTPLTNVVVAPGRNFRYVINPPYANGDKFSYGLDAGAPIGAQITIKKGVTAFSWTPTMAQASTTNLISIRMTDNTTPALSTNRYIQVVVLDYLELDLGSTAIQAGQSGTVPLYLSSSDAVTNLSFTVCWPSNSFAAPAMSVSVPTLANGTLQSQGTNYLLKIQALPGQVLQGSNQIALLTLPTVPTQRSAFIKVTSRLMAGSKSNGAGFSNLLSGWAQVALVGDVPLVQAATPNGSARTLSLFGKVGSSYQLQYCTNILAPAAWYSLLTYSQTNVAQTLSVSSNSPVIYYRLKQ